MDSEREERRQELEENFNLKNARVSSRCEGLTGRNMPVISNVSMIKVDDMSDMIDVDSTTTLAIGLFLRSSKPGGSSLVVSSLDRYFKLIP